MTSDFGKGPAYGSWPAWSGHEGANQPMASLKGSMGPVFTQMPMDSEAMTGGRVATGAESPGPAWDECFRAPMATPTRGTHNY